MHMNDTEMKEVHFLIKCLECQVIKIWQLLQSYKTLSSFFFYKQSNVC